MEENKKTAEEILKPVNMYQIAARLFASVAESVIEQFGEAGEAAVVEGVRRFGEARGRHIAERAFADGKSNTVENYLEYYDMERSELFTYDTIYRANEIEQTFTECVFARQWQEDGNEKYGMLYCEHIDPSIARGFNANFEVEHDKHFYTDHVCHFCFKMKDCQKEDHEG